MKQWSRSSRSLAVWSLIAALSGLVPAGLVAEAEPPVGEKTPPPVGEKTTPPAGEKTPPPTEPAARPPFELLEGSGLVFVHDNGMTGERYLPEITCGGGALLDFDNDGDLDIYLVQGRPLTAKPDEGASPGDRLFRNDLELASNGRRVPRFTDVTEASGIRAFEYGCGVTAADFDNDGLVDLYVTNFGPNQLWRNQGDGTFRELAKASGADDARWSVSASAADFNADGWLDLYVANYLDFTLEKNKECRTASGARDYCHPDAYLGVPDALFYNRGKGDGIAFDDRSISSGIGGELSKSLGVVVADLDSDGLLDVYVANDGVANQLWMQQAGGRFRDQALLAGCAVNGRGLAEASMGVTVEDVDTDGDPDLFMTHLGGETNTLFVNDGRGGFEDRTIPVGLAIPSWEFTSWGLAFLDYDNDGRRDLMIVNGAVRVIEALASAGDPYPFHQRNQLFRGLGGGRFADVSAESSVAFELSEVSRALAVGDLDNDGDPDALIVNNNGPARLLLNRVGQDRRWLGLRLVGDGGRDMLGARVEVLDGAGLWRRAANDGSFASAGDPRVLIGLGESDNQHPVRVLWPDGQVETWDALDLDRYTTLRQGSGRKGE